MDQSEGGVRAGVAPGASLLLARRDVSVALGVVTAAWALALNVAYVGAHPEVARLPELLRSVWRARSASTELAFAWSRNLEATFVAVVVALACYGFGRAVGRYVPESGMSAGIVEAGKFILGSAIGACLMFVAGRVGLFNRATGVVLALAGLGLLAHSLRGGALRAARCTARARTAEFAGDAWTWLPLAVVALIGVAVLLEAWAPPTARDALAYHLAVPKAYIAHGRIVEIPQNVYSYLPFSAEMLYTWTMLLGPGTAAAVLHLLFGAVATAGVYCLGSEFAGAPRWGALAAALFVTVPSVGWNAGLAHNEMIRSLALTVAIGGVASWFSTRQEGAIVWSGIALGFALSAKHTELVVLPMFVLVVLLGFRRTPVAERSTVARGVAVASLALVAIPAPWYLQNLAWTGDPLFPYFWTLFPTHSSVWTADHAAVAEQYLRVAYGGEGILAQLRLPWDVSIASRDDVPRLFDGVLGPALLLIAPFVLALSVWRDHVDIRWRIAAALVAGGFVAWASQSQQIRFLVPLAAVGTAVAVVPPGVRGLGRWTRSALVGGLALATAANVLVFGAGVAEANPLLAAVGLESREAYLSRRLEYYPFYQVLDAAVPPDGRVFLVCTRNDTYYLDVDAYSDSMLEDFTMGQIVNGARTSDDVYRAFQERGFTHLLVRHDILLGARTTVFVDADATERYLDFLRAHTRLVRGDETYTLFEIL